MSALLLAALLVSAPTPVTPPTPRIASYRAQTEPAVAWNAGVGLVVWHGEAGWVRHLYASRVDASGTPIDSAPFLISNAGDHARLHVVALGDKFLVAWQSLDGTGVNGAIVDRDGGIRSLGVLAAYPFYLTDLASSGSTALLLGSGGDPKFENVAIWLDSEGRQFARKEFGDAAYTSRVAWSGNDFVIVWRKVACGVYLCDASFFEAIASTSGTVGSPRVLLERKGGGPSDIDVLDISAMPDRTMLVFLDFQAMTGAVVTRTSPISSTFVIESDGISGAYPTVSNDGTDFAVFYPHVTGSAQPRDAHALVRSISKSGSVSAPRELGQVHSQFAVVWNGQAYLTARSEPRRQVYNVFARLLAPSGDWIGSESLLSHAPSQQESPSAAFDGETLMVAWEQFNAIEERWTLRYGDGSLIAPANSDQRNPKIVFDGSLFTIFWTEIGPSITSTIWGRRVNRGGVAGRLFEVTRTACHTPFDAAALTSSLVMIAYSDCSRVSTGGQRELMSIAVDSREIVSAPTLLTTGAPERPSIAGSGNNAMIVWHASVPRSAGEECPRGYEFCLPKQILRAAVMDGGALRTIDLPTEGFVNLSPVVAWNGTNFLVVWANASDVIQPIAFKGRLFSAAGEPASSIIPISPGYSIPSDNTRSAVTWNGVNFVIAWLPGNAGDKLAISTLVDAHETLIETRAMSLQQIALAPGSRGTAFLTYSVAGPEAEFLGHNHVVVRTISEGSSRRRAVR